METFKIDKFAGMARAVAPGVAYPPSKLFNLNMDALGGYAVLGKLANTGLGDTGVLRVIGIDQIGRASIVASSGNYAVIEDGVLYQSNLKANDTDVIVHIPGFGIFAGDQKIFGRTASGYVGSDVVKDYKVSAEYFKNPQIYFIGETPDDGGQRYLCAVFWLRNPQSGNMVLKVQFIGNNGAYEQFVAVDSNPDSVKIRAPKMDSEVFVDIYYGSSSISGGENMPLTFVKTLASEESFIVDGFPTGTILENAGFPIFRLAETHKGRVYGVGVYPFYDEKDIRLNTSGHYPPSFPKSLAGSQMLVVTDPGRLNFSSTPNYFPISPTQSTKITALSSASGVLIIFFDNETWFLSGDSPQNFSLDLFPFPAGCDEGVTPAKLGGKVYPIWKGRIYEVGGGGGREIGAVMYKPSDPFTAISSDSHTGHLIVQTKSNTIFRYDPKNDSWANDLVEGPVNFLPSKDGLAYLSANGRLSKVQVAEKPSPNPELEFEKIDCGKPYEEKLFRRVWFAVTGNVRRVSLDFSVDGKPGYTGIEGVRDVAGRFVFSLPSPVGIYAKIKFTLEDCEPDVVVVPPIEIEYEVKRRKL